MKNLLAIMLVLILASLSTVSAEEHGMMDNENNQENSTMMDNESQTSTTGAPIQDNTPNSTDTTPVYNTGSSSTSIDRENRRNEFENKMNERRDELRSKKEERRNEFENKINERKNELRSKKEEMKRSFNERKNEMRNNREEMRNNKEEMKNDREGMKSEFRKLDDNTKTELKDTYKKYRDEMNNLKKEYKDSLNDEGKRDDIKTQMETLRQDSYNNVKTIVGNNPTILNKIKQKESIFKKNLQLRKNDNIARKVLRGDRAKFISKYKKSFNLRLKNVIDRIPDSKLQIVAKKIDDAIVKIENNSRLSDMKKNNIMDQVLALKEIIDERIAASSATTDVIDINSLLTF